MDKKTIIGIGIIAFILILSPFWQKLLVGEAPAQPPQTEQSTAQVDTSVHTTMSATTPTDSLSVSAAQNPTNQPIPPQNIAPAKDIVVRTDKFDIILSTGGGDIKSIILKEFKSAAGAKIDLAPNPLERHNMEFVANIAGTQQNISSANAVYNADAESLVIDENNPTGAITMLGVLPNGTAVQKRFEFEYGTYVIRHKLTVAAADSTVKFGEAALWWNSGMVPVEKDPGHDIQETYVHMRIGDSYDKIKPAAKKPERFEEGTTDWAAVGMKYFTVAILPQNEFSCTGVRTKTVFAKVPSIEKEVPIMAFALVENVRNWKFDKTYTIYAGPREITELTKLGRRADRIVDLGWTWLAPITRGLLWVFRKLFAYIPNYGWVIIIFTILMKLLLIPFSTSQLKSMKKTKDLQPQLRSIQERYRDDPQKMNAETMKLYKKSGVNPLSGCLPLLAQMPVFFALYRALAGGFEFRGRPFVLWLHDLSQADPIFVLPIVMGITMFIQQKISVTDPKQQMMVYIMPVIFTFLFYKLPAGLVLYWTVFNILSIFHMLWVEHTWKGDATQMVTVIDETHDVRKPKK